jgi:CHASE2 domain-containing sensor protein
LVGKNRPELISVGKLAIATFAIVALLLGMRQLGWLQQLEVMAYDQMVRWREEPE